MSENSNQHFVPKCHLRQFASDVRQKQICVFNLGIDRMIPRASLADQCAKHHFYGSDLVLERAFQGFEGRYSESVECVKRGIFTEREKLNLMYFALLQFHRTEAAARRAVTRLQDVVTAIDPEERHFSKKDIWDEKQSLTQVLSLVAASHRFIIDLKSVLIRNQSSVDFITSDDPSSITNMYANQRLRTKSFGMTSSGFTLTLPLSPRYAVIFYDALVYSIPNKIGSYLDIRRDIDAQSINELQYQKCDKNLYCSSPASEGLIREGLRSAERKRVEFSAKPIILRRVSSVDGVAEYVRDENPNIYEGGPHLIYHEVRYPVPNRWLPEIKIKMLPKTFHGEGQNRNVRNPLWLTKEGRIQFLNRSM